MRKSRTRRSRKSRTRRSRKSRTRRINRFKKQYYLGGRYKNKKLRKSRKINKKYGGRRRQRGGAAKWDRFSERQVVSNEGIVTQSKQGWSLTTCEAARMYKGNHSIEFKYSPLEGGKNDHIFVGVVPSGIALAKREGTLVANDGWEGDGAMLIRLNGSYARTLFGSSRMNRIKKVDGKGVEQPPVTETDVVRVDVDYPNNLVNFFINDEFVDGFEKRLKGPVVPAVQMFWPGSSVQLKSVS